MSEGKHQFLQTAMPMDCILFKGSIPDAKQTKKRSKTSKTFLEIIFYKSSTHRFFFEIVIVVRVARLSLVVLFAQDAMEEVVKLKEDEPR